MNSENIVGSKEIAACRETAICPKGFVVLLDKFAVDAMLFEAVQCSLNDIRPCLLEGVDYTAEDLIGAELWSDWAEIAQRQAYLCLKHLATLPETDLIDMANETGGMTSFRFVQNTGVQLP